MKSDCFMREYGRGVAGYCLFMLLMVTSCTLAQAAVTAHVDRFNIAEGETINLSIRADGDSGGQPDTAPLDKDFEILSRNQSSSITFINGKSSRSKTWQMVLMPRHSGALTIPAITVGKAATKPILIQVSRDQARSTSDAGPTGDLSISMDIAPKSVRVQQQAIITIRIYQAVNLNQAQLSEPAAEHAVIEKLGDDTSYQKQINGRNWLVTERRYALFPQQSGVITINPVQLDGAVLTGGAGFFQTPRTIRKRSNGLTLDVAGIPTDWPGLEWLPATALSIDEQWPQAKGFTVGEPITRTITIRADGLSASQLPELANDLPDHLKGYPDKPRLDDAVDAHGVHGKRQQKIAIMPMQAGTYILPEIDVTWWNTERESVEHATLPARTFKVVAAPASAAPSTPRQSNSEKPTVSPSVAQAAANSGTEAGGVAPWWRWLALFCALGWLITLLLIWRMRRKSPDKESDNRQSISVKEATKSVVHACESDDEKACERALIELANAQFPDYLCHSLDALMSLCDDALQSELRILERARYAPDAPVWQGSELLKVFRESGGFQRPSATTEDRAKALPPLYPE